MENNAVSIFNIDYLELLKNQKDSSIDLILIDPPYFISRDTNFAK